MRQGTRVRSATMPGATNKDCQPTRTAVSLPTSFERGARCMRLKDFTTPTMVVVTGHWLDPNRDRPRIEALPRASGLLPVLEGAHDRLLTVQSMGKTALPALMALQKEQGLLDGTHDRKSRGGYNLLTALADLVDDPAEAEKLLALRDTMYPHGMRVVQWSYVDEAGEAELVERRLTNDDRDLLKQITYKGGTLFDAHQKRVESARKLGELEKKKLALLDAQEAGNGKPMPGDVVKARNAWIRAVNAFLAVLDLEEGLSEADREELLRPLREAEKKSRKGGNDEEGSGGGGAPAA